MEPRNVRLRLVVLSGLALAAVRQLRRRVALRSVRPAVGVRKLLRRKVALRSVRRRLPDPSVLNAPQSVRRPLNVPLRLNVLSVAAAVRRLRRKSVRQRVLLSVLLLPSVLLHKRKGRLRNSVPLRRRSVLLSGPLLDVLQRSLNAGRQLPRKRRARASSAAGASGDCA